VVPRLDVPHMDAAIASEMVLDALAVAVGSKVSIFHGVAGAGRKPVTISVRQTKVYEILNNIVSTQGKCIWVASAPPRELSKLQGNLWHLYSLEPEYESIVMGVLGEIFPR